MLCLESKLHDLQRLSGDYSIMGKNISVTPVLPVNFPKATQTSSVTIQFNALSTPQDPYQTVGRLHTRGQIISVL